MTWVGSGSMEDDQATSKSALGAYEKAFARWIGAERAFAFWKGRVALYAILKAMGIGEADEVIVPGYTCVMAVSPIVYLGARPIYVDIEPATFNINPSLIEERISPRTRVIIAQHTYGYPADMDRIMAIADGRGIPVIEDCCLALGSRWKGRKVGTIGVASYFSSQWNKPFTTGMGGVAVTSAPKLASAMATVQSERAIQPGLAETMVLACQLAAYQTLVYPKTTAFAQTVFRWLGGAGLALGSSAPREFLPTMPEGFCKIMSKVQARAGLRKIRGIDRAIAHRRAMGRLYDDLLGDIGWPLPRIPDALDPVLVRYPVRVKDKALALRSAARHFVELGSWFECPLHPIETPMNQFGYETGMCPVAERASAEVVNLPVHPRVNSSTARRTVDFIARIGPADTGPISTARRGEVSEV